MENRLPLILFSFNCDLQWFHTTDIKLIKEWAGEALRTGSIVQIHSRRFIVKALVIEPSIASEENRQQMPIWELLEGDKYNWSMLATIYLEEITGLN